MARKSVHATWFLLIHAILMGQTVSASQQEAMLDNGLHVLVREQPDQSLVTVEVFYAAGAAAEPDSLAGLAHFAEHLLVMGDKTSEAGSRRRRFALLAFTSNAFTWPTVMSFRSECLPTFLPRILDLEAERMQGVQPDDAVFERERSVVLSEWSYRTGSRETSVSVAAFRGSFPDHPYSRAVSGTPESIRRITADDFADFIARNIHPAAAVLIIEGPVDPSTVLDLVRERFADLEGKAAPDPLPPYPVAAAGQVILDSRDHTGLKMSAAVRVPLTTPRDLVLAHLAGEYMQIAFSAVDLTIIQGEAVFDYSWYGPYYQPDSSSGVGSRSFDPRRDAQSSLSWSWARINEAIADLSSPNRREELTEWLVEAIDQRQGRMLSRWTVGTALLAGNPVPTTDEYHELVRGISLNDIQHFLAKYLVTERTFIALSHGRDSERVAFKKMAGRVVRDHEIKATDPLDGLTVAEIQPVLNAYAESDILHLATFTLRNDIPVVYQLVPGKESWNLAGWRRFDPVKDARQNKRPGICSVYNWTVGYDPILAEEGHPQRSWPHDAWFSLSPGGLYRFAASGRYDQAADVAASLVERLDIDQFNLKVWASVLYHGETRLSRMSRRGSYRAAAWRRAQMLGEDHPSLSPAKPDPGIMDDLKYKDMSKLHRRTARPTGDTTLLAVGGLPADSVQALLDDSFGKRDRFKAWTPPSPPPGVSAIAGTIRTISSQTDVTLSLTFPAYVPDPSWEHSGLSFLLLRQVINQILDSRLRQEEGWTYTTSFDFLAVSGWILPEIHVTCQPGQAPAVLSIVKQELESLSATGYTKDQLALARLKLVSLILRSSGNPYRLQSWIRLASMFSPMPEDPVTTVLSLDPVASGIDLSDLVPADRFVFSAVGAIFEEDMDLFEY